MIMIILKYVTMESIRRAFIAAAPASYTSIYCVMVTQIVVIKVTKHLINAKS